MSTHSSRKATNVSLDSGLMGDAGQLGINVSRACECGLTDEVAKVRTQLWREKNREAIASSNAYVEKYGLPLARCGVRCLCSLISEDVRIGNAIDMLLSGF